MKKILIAMILTICCIVCNITVLGSETVDANTTELLSCLGIVDEERNSSDKIKRIEFLQYALRVTNEYHVAEGCEPITIFNDVPKTMEGANFVTYAYEQGYVIGNDGNFNPNSTINLYEACVILFRMTGYDFISAEKGFSYALIESGIDKGISVSNNDDLRYGDLCILLENILKAPHYETTIFGEQRVTLGDSSKSIMNYYLGVYCNTGILQKANGVSLKEAEYNRSDAVIDNITYYTDGYDISSLVGYKIKYYYSVDVSGERTVLAAFADKNNVLKIDAAALVTSSSQYSTQKIVYWNENGKKDIADISRYAYMIYNNEGFVDFTTDTLKINEGTLTLVDNNNDDVYDVICASVPQSIVVSNISTSDRIVKGTDGSKINMSIDNNRTVSIMGIDETYYEFTDISEGHILTVFQSQSGRKTVVYVSSNIVTDKIEEIGEDDERVYVKAGGKVYYFDRNFIVPGQNYSTILNMDTNTGLYLDVFGHVVGIGEKTSKYFNYGYVVAQGQMLGLDGKHQIRLFVEDGKFVNYTLADKIKCSTGINQTPEQVINNLNNNGLNILVKFEINGKGEIDELYVPVDNSSSEKADLNNFSWDGTSAGGGLNKYRSGILSSKYLISNDTVIFGVPANKKDEEKYRVMRSSDLIVNENYSFDVYELDEVNTAGVIVMLPATTYEYPREVFIVDRTYKICDENGEEFNKVEGYINGEYKSHVILDEPGVDNVNPVQGDVLKIYADSDDQIIATKTLIRLSENPSFGEGTYETGVDDAYALQSKGYWQYGKVGSVKNGAFIMSTDNGATFRPNSITSSNVYIYDRTYKKIYKAAVSDINSSSAVNIFDGSTVFVNKRWDSVADIIVVR